MRPAEVPFTQNNNSYCSSRAHCCTAALALTCRWSSLIEITDLLHCNASLSWYIPRRTSVVAGDWRILQKVQLHVVVELLRRARVQGLREVLDLCHEVIHVLLHGGEIQREALRGVAPVGPVRWRRWCASRLWVAATPEPPCAKRSGLHQHQEQHWWNHSDRCHRIHGVRCPSFKMQSLVTETQQFSQMERRK